MPDYKKSPLDGSVLQGLASIQWPWLSNSGEQVQWGVVFGIFHLLTLYAVVILGGWRKQRKWLTKIRWDDAKMRNPPLIDFQLFGGSEGGVHKKQYYFNIWNRNL